MITKLILAIAIAVLEVLLNSPHSRAQCPDSVRYATPIRDFIGSRPILSLLELRRDRVEAGVAFMPVRALAYCTPVRNFIGACADGRREQLEMGQPWTPVRNVFFGRRNR